LFLFGAAALIIFAPEAHAPLAHNMHPTKQVHAEYLFLNTETYASHA
jgi:hypothetical protein